MKRIINLVIGFMFLSSLEGYSQACTTGNILTNPYLCGTYGDANGVSKWDWEVDPEVDPNNIALQQKYCETWSARTQQGDLLTLTRSPFKRPATSKMTNIAIEKDYTRAKGWELVTRDFGCEGPVSYPYFVLYNKYTTLLRVFVYQPIPKENYSQVVVEITPSSTFSYPATTSLGDDLVTAPDKYLATASSKPFGKRVVSVTEPSGSGGWYVAEFNMGFDPNIGDIAYQNKALQFTIYGEAQSTITADITGSGVTGDKVYDFSYAPTSNPTGSGEKTFTAAGESFIKFSKGIDDAMASAYKASNDIVNSLADHPYDNSLKGRLKGLAWNIREASSTKNNFGQALSQVADFMAIGGSVLKFLGSAIGMFSGSMSSVAPTYTSYNLKLKGTITCKDALKSFTILIPGTQQTTTIGATYYRCPMGIFNLKNTPQADKVTYSRVYAYHNNFVSPPDPLNRDEKRADFISIRMNNDLQVSYNEGAGLDLVSVQAAIVGKVQQAGNEAAYDLTKDHGGAFAPAWYEFNYMLPDLQAGFLEITSYDPQYKLHTFQTPYVNIQCINGLAFNARAETDVFLRVKAIMKRKNDPAASPIIYIRDYKIDFTEGEMSSTLRNNHFGVQAYKYPTPYSNYSEVPDYMSVADKLINNANYTGTSEEKADNVISTGDNVYVSSGADVIFKAGYMVDLYPGFEAEPGSNFEATLKSNQSNITCGALQAQPYVFGQNCWNSTISPARQETKPAKLISETANPQLLKVYPIPTNGKLFIEGVKANSKATITFLDQSGRSVKELRSSSFDGGRIDVDVSSLSNGVYFVKIQTLEEIITRKIVVTK
jgi:hypothetical protein